MPAQPVSHLSHTLHVLCTLCADMLAGLTARPEVDEYEHSSHPAQQPPAASSSSSSSRGLQEPILPTHSQQGQQQHHTAAANPYSIDAQARLTLRICELLGLRRVLLVGHADGCVVAAHAAAAACRHQQHHHHHHHHPSQQHRPVSSGGRSSSSSRLGQPTYVNTGLENQGSIDFSWMGSLGKVSCRRLLTMPHVHGMHTGHNIRVRVALASLMQCWHETKLLQGQATSLGESRRVGISCQQQDNLRAYSGPFPLARWQCQPPDTSPNS